MPNKKKAKKIIIIKEEFKNPFQSFCIKSENPIENLRKLQVEDKEKCFI
jgi:hypothetical protein